MFIPDTIDDEVARGSIDGEDVVEEQEMALLGFESFGLGDFQRDAGGERLKAMKDAAMFVIYFSAAMEMEISRFGGRRGFLRSGLRSPHGRVPSDVEYRENLSPAFIHPPLNLALFGGP